MKEKRSQDDPDIGAAPFLILGTLWMFAGITPLIMGIFMEGILTDLMSLVYFTLLPGAGMLLIGIGIMNRWRFIGIPAMVLCGMYLLNFPLGTLLGGWAPFSLWKARAAFYPFDKKAKPRSLNEDGAAV